MTELPEPISSFCAVSNPLINDEDLVPISALQHMLYCPRQCALIHIERQWSENRFTAEGRILHEHVDKGKSSKRGGVRVERNVPLRSHQLGLSGLADVVEVYKEDPPYLIEYKRGRPKAHRADEVQLCAQAMCLEEMLSIMIPEGALFYGKTRRRKPVAFDHELRELTKRVAQETRRLLAAGETPAPEYAPRKCNSCSLQSVCQPQKSKRSGYVDQWLAKVVET